MKKLAVIGASSVSFGNGYGVQLKRELGDECDLFGSVGTGVEWPLFTILNNDIIDQYENVIIQFTWGEVIDNTYNPLGQYMCISMWAYIFKLFSKSKSRLLILVSAYNTTPRNFYNYYYIFALCEIFNIEVIDFRKDLIFCNGIKVTYDGIHFLAPITNYIARTILTYLETGGKNKREIKNIAVNISYNIYEPKDKGLKQEIITALNAKRTFYYLTLENTMRLPDESYLCALFFWHTPGGMPYILYQNPSIRLAKYLSYWRFFPNYFHASLLGSNTYSGLKGGYLEATYNTDYAQMEPIWAPPKWDIDKRSQVIKINSFLLSDAPPIIHGMNFINTHLASFINARDETNRIILEYKGISIEPIWKELEEYIPNGDEIFKSILKERLDLAVCFKSSELRAERLIIWAWQYGLEEIPALHQYLGIFAKSINKMSTLPYGETGLSRLLYAIWLSREDLHHFEINTEDGLKALLKWFVQYGAQEYKIREALSYAD